MWGLIPLSRQWFRMSFDWNIVCDTLVAVAVAVVVVVVVVVIVI